MNNLKPQATAWMNLRNVMLREGCSAPSVMALSVFQEHCTRLFWGLFLCHGPLSLHSFVSKESQYCRGCWAQNHGNPQPSSPCTAPVQHAALSVARSPLSWNCTGPVAILILAFIIFFFFLASLSMIDLMELPVVFSSAYRRISSLFMGHILRS